MVSRWPTKRHSPSVARGSRPMARQATAWCAVRASGPLGLWASRTSRSGRGTTTPRHRQRPCPPSPPSPSPPPSESHPGRRPRAHKRSAQPVDAPLDGSGASKSQRARGQGAREIAKGWRNRGAQYLPSPARSLAVARGMAWHGWLHRAAPRRAIFGPMCCLPRCARCLLACWPLAASGPPLAGPVTRRDRKKEARPPASCCSLLAALRLLDRLR